MRKMKIAAIAVIVLLLAACGKAVEKYQDADVTSRNSSPAEVGTMPDGFGNWAAKCHGPNMVYVLFHKDAYYGAIAVVANDPRCK